MLFMNAAFGGWVQYMRYQARVNRERVATSELEIKNAVAAIEKLGSRFVERMLSVVATCRQQNRNVLELLTACCRARLDGSAAPSLLPAQAKLVAA